MKFPFYRQLDEMDCGPTCLRMVAKHYGRSFSLQTLREKSQINREGVSMFGIANAAESIGFSTMGTKMPFEILTNEVPLPCIVHWGNNHFVVVYKISRRKKTKNNNQTIFVADPGTELIAYSAAEFKSKWERETENGPQGFVLLLEPTPSFFKQEDEKQDLGGFKRIAAYLFQYKRLISQLFVGILFSSIIQFIMPFITQSLVDIGVNTHNLPFVYLAITAMILLMAGKQAIEYIRGWILLHISTRLNLSVLSDFLIKLMRLPLPFFDAKKIGDIFRRVDDNRRIEEFLTGQSLTVFFSVLDLALLALVLLYFNTWMFVIYVSGALLHLGWVSMFLKQRRLLDYKHFDLDAKKHNGLLEIISGMPDIKLAGAERQLRWAWERLQARVFHLQVKTLSLNQYQHGGGFVILNIVNLLILFMSVKAAIDGQITLGAMLAIQFIVSQLHGPVDQLVRFAHEVQDAKISLERLNEIHTIEDEESDDFTKTGFPINRQDIILKSVSFAYPGMVGRSILQQLSLIIPQNKTTAIVGMSGSGKTTLLKLLLRFYNPTSGEINIGASPLRDIHLGEWRSKCGVVMQDGYIFSDTIARNIALGHEQIDINRLRHAIQVAHIADLIDDLPLGINTKIGAEGNGLSQGQKQRLLIARAVYKDPEFLFFDEATNALDANNEMAVMQALDNFFKGRTVVVVAHRLSTVRDADNIVVLEGGRIIEQGNHAELISHRGAYWNLVKNQLELATTND
ncbi:MAG: peptidase domain-containing ABC transporter [Pedobacter sp.]|nr:MAG: peptidase domain-containing ABC transporter [Pedobacter sp.]